MDGEEKVTMLDGMKNECWTCRRDIAQVQEVFKKYGNGIALINFFETDFGIVRLCMVCGQIYQTCGEQAVGEFVRKMKQKKLRKLSKYDLLDELRERL